MSDDNAGVDANEPLRTRGYQQEMLEASLRRNVVIAMDTGAGKTHIAVLRMKIEAEREPRKVSAKLPFMYSDIIFICRFLGSSRLQ